MLIRPTDHDVLKSFIYRESREFCWIDGIKGQNAKIFRAYLFDMINDYSPAEGVEYICIESLSNMGFTVASLMLTVASEAFALNKKVLSVYLPPTPKGKPSFHIKG